MGSGGWKKPGRRKRGNGGVKEGDGNEKRQNGGRRARRMRWCNKVMCEKTGGRGGT